MPGGRAKFDCVCLLLHECCSSRFSTCPEVDPDPLGAGLGPTRGHRRKRTLYLPTVAFFIGRWTPLALYLPTEQQVGCENDKEMSLMYLPESYVCLNPFGFLEHALLIRFSKSVEFYGCQANENEGAAIYIDYDNLEFLPQEATYEENSIINDVSLNRGVFARGSGSR